MTTSSATSTEQSLYGLLGGITAAIIIGWIAGEAGLPPAAQGTLASTGLALPAALDYHRKARRQNPKADAAALRQGILARPSGLVAGLLAAAILAVDSAGGAFLAVSQGPDAFIMVILGVVVAFIASHASHYFRDRPYRWTAEAVGIAAVLRLVIVALLWHHLTVNVEDAPTFGDIIPDVLIGFAIYLPFALAGTYIGRRNHDRFIAKKLAQAEAKAKHTATYTASFTATTPQGPPAGWYNDPGGLLNIERYWDGTAWTDQRRNAASSSP